MCAEDKKIYYFLFDKKKIFIQLYCCNTRQHN